MKTKRNITIPISLKQRKAIDNFLAKNNVYLDGKTKFALLAQPLLHERKLEILLLTEKEHTKLYWVFSEMGLNV